MAHRRRSFPNTRLRNPLPTPHAPRITALRGREVPRCRDRGLRGRVQKSRVERWPGEREARERERLRFRCDAERDDAGRAGGEEEAAF